MTMTKVDLDTSSAAVLQTRDKGVVSGSSRCGDGVANMFLMSVRVMTLRLPRPEPSPTLDKRNSYGDHWALAGVIMIQT